MTPSAMSTLLTSITDVFTQMVTWAGSLITFIVGQPILLIPFALGLVGATLSFIKKARHAA